MYERYKNVSHTGSLDPKSLVLGLRNLPDVLGLLTQNYNPAAARRALERWASAIDQKTQNNLQTTEFWREWRVSAIDFSA